MDDATRGLILILAVAAAFFIISAILMALWNATVPKLAESVDPTYKTADFRNISYPTAMLLALLTGIVFGGSNRMMKAIR